MEVDVNEVEREAYRTQVEHAMRHPETARRLTKALTAIETLVCGRPGSGATAAEPIFVAGMRLTPEERDMHVLAAGRDGRDCVYVGFDVDDIDADPAIMVLRPQGETVVVEYGCRLWIALGASKAVIVPIGDDADGCYGFRQGSRLVHAANRPASNLQGGTLRAQARVRRLAASSEAAAEVRSSGSRSTMTSLGNGVLVHACERLAA